MTAETKQSVITQARLEFEPFEIESQVRQALALSLRECDKSRAWVAATVQELSGHKCTEDSLHNWCALSKNGIWRIPFCVIPAFCWATQDIRVFQVGQKPINSMLVSKRMEELAQLDEAERRIRARRAELEGKYGS